MGASANIGDSVTRMAGWIVAYALPPRCPGCGTIVEADDSFCTACWQNIDFLGEPCCARCGLPLDFFMGTDAECGNCIANPPPYDSARAATVYGLVTREIALRLKYGRRLGLARLMARFMVQAIPPQAIKNPDWLLLPVPLHRWRQWRRGFNQAAVMADHLSRDTGIVADKLMLIRHRATPSLRDLNARKRAKVLRGAFSVNPKRAQALRGKKILLVDDVHTSGATARECVEALRRAGVDSVHLLSWARVLNSD